MKRGLNFLVSLLLIITSIVSYSTMSFGNNKNTSPQAYKAYYDILNPLINGTSDSDTGIYILNSGEFDFSYLSSNKYLIHAELIDFDNDKDEELFYMYTTGDGHYIYEVYAYENNKLQKLISKKIPLGIGTHVSHSTDLIVINDITYIYDYYYLKHEIEYTDTYNITSFKNTEVIKEEYKRILELTDEQEMGIIEGLLYEDDFYVHTKNINGSEKNITSDELDNTINKYENANNSKSLLSNDINYYSSGLNLDCDRYNEISEFLFDILNKSYVISFKNAKDILSNNDYEYLDKFFRYFIFLGEYNEVDIYDKNNIDNAKILNFIFNLSLYNNYEEYKNDIEYITDKFSENFKSSMKLEKVKEIINELFGISFSLNEGNTLYYSSNKFTLNDGIILREGSYPCEEFDLGPRQSHIKNIYHISNNFYLLDVNYSVYEGGEYFPSKYFAIVEKLGDSKFNLVMLNHSEISDDEVKNCIQSLSSDKTVSNFTEASLPYKFIIAVPICITIILICIGLLFMKFTNKEISIIIISSIVIISSLIGLLSFIFINNKYKHNIDNSALVNQISNSQSNTEESKKDIIKEPEIIDNTEESSDEISEESSNIVEENYNESEEIDSSYMDFESATNLIKDRVKSYEKDYAEAVNSGDFYILEPHLLPEGTMYNQFNDIVNDYYSRNLKIISYDHNVDNIVDLGDGEYKLNIYEKFGVIKDGAEKIKEFDSIYTVKIKNGICYMKDILL